MWETDNLSFRDLESKYDHVGDTEALQVVSLMNMTCVCYFVKMQNTCKYKNYPVFLNPCDLFSKEPYALIPHSQFSKCKPLYSKIERYVLST